MKKTWLVPMMICAICVLNSASANAEAILVSFYTTGTSPAKSSDFVTALHATGGLATQIAASPVTGIDLGAFNSRPASWTSGGITITTTKGSEYAYPVPPHSIAGITPIDANGIVGGKGTVTDTITGLPLLGHDTYVFDVIATPLFNGATESITLTYDGKSETISGLKFGQDARFEFRTTTGGGAVTLTLSEPKYTSSGPFVGFSAFAAHTVPEPSSMALLGLGGLVLGAYRRFRPAMV